MADNADDVALAVLDRLGDWRLQVGIWKWAVQGDVTEQDSLTSEFPNRYGCGFWDQTQADLDSVRIDRGRGWESVPEWYAFHHLPMAWREDALAQSDGRITPNEEGGSVGG